MKNIDDIFVEMVKLLNDIIPIEWSKIWLNTEYEAGDCLIYYYFLDSETNKAIEYGDLIDKLGVERRNVNKCSRELMFLIEDLNELMAEKENANWTAMTFIIDDTGIFNTYFSYKELDDRSHERRLKWEQKYLSDFLKKV